MNTSALQRWLQLSLAYRLDAAQLKSLCAAATSTDSLLALTPSDLAALALPAEAWPWFLQWQQGRVEDDVQCRVDRALAWLDDPAHHIVTWGDAHYPALLATCNDAPPQLFVRGDIAALALPQLAMVGSRRPTPCLLYTSPSPRD